MSNNAFVISSSQIQFVSFDKNKKKLVFSLKKKIEEGVIERGKIEDKERFETIISEFIKEIKFNIDKAVVVVAEDRVISKSLSLPKMNLSEVDEAVSWEAEKYLPYKLGDMILDWELISYNGENHVLFEALEKDLIDDYVKIFEKLKIEITAIETPALSLVRISEKNDEAKILIHVSEKEAVLTLAKDKQVMATSVLKVSKNIDKKLVNTVLRMISYYKKFKVKQIQIGGMGVNSGMVEKLAETKLKIDGFSIPFAVRPEIANNFLLSISASLKENYLPENEKNINLLPNWYVDKNRKKRQKGFWKKMMIFAGIVLTLNTIMLSGTYFWILREEEKQLTSSNQITASRKNVLSETRGANSLVKTILKLIKYDYFPNDLINKIEEKAEDNITLAGISLKIMEGKGGVSGIAKDRDKLINYKQELEKIEAISNITLPVSSFTEEKNIPFQLSFSIDEESLRKEEE